MKQRPILFSTEMVQAILAGRKTQTRRVVKPPKGIRYYFDDGKCVLEGEDDYIDMECPYGVPGDVLWVREAYCPKYFDRNIHCYKADFNETAYEFVSEPKWKPSIHMPKDAARIWLRIKDVRVERLQDISHDDAEREGVHSRFKEPHDCGYLDPTHSPLLYKNYLAKGMMNISPAESFITLWQSINGSDSWNDNPFVWVIEFERIEKPHP